jgi:hypothetical protein
MAEQRHRLQQAEADIWSVDFRVTTLPQIAALIGARNEADWLVNRVPSLIQDIQAALAKIDIS